MRYRTNMVDRDHPIALLSGVTRNANSTRARVYTHKAALFDKIGLGPHVCHWCRTPVGWTRGVKPGALVADHLDGDNQNNDPANLVAACNSCNTMRARTVYRPAISEDELFVVHKDGKRTRAVECVCQICEATFLADVSRVKRGTVRVCSKRCAGRIALNNRWGPR